MADANYSIALTLYKRLKNFKFIYYLYFLADILYNLSMLSRLFQQKFVDISSIDSIIRTQVGKLRMFYVTESIDLSVDTFNESTRFHILPNFGPSGGYLRRLSYEIRGSKFYNVQIIWDSIGSNLEEALLFQKNFAEAVTTALESCFDDHGLVASFKILSPTNMPAK
jgi:hypothetical protein